MVKRILRLLCVDLYFLSCFGLYRLIVCGGYGPEQRLPVPEWYDDTVVFRNSIARQMLDFKREVDAAYERVLSYGARLGGFDTSRGRPNQVLENTSVAQWMDHFEEKATDFARDWGAAVLACLFFCFIWLTDHFIIQLF